MKEKNSPFSTKFVFFFMSQTLRKIDFNESKTAMQNKSFKTSKGNCYLNRNILEISINIYTIINI